MVYDYESKSIHDDLMVMKARKSMIASSNCHRLEDTRVSPPSFKSPIQRMRRSVGNMFNKTSPEVGASRKKASSFRQQPRKNNSNRSNTIDEDHEYSYSGEDNDTEWDRNDCLEEDYYKKDYSKEMDFNDSLFTCDLEDAIGKALERTSSQKASQKKKKGRRGRF